MHLCVLKRSAMFTWRAQGQGAATAFRTTLMVAVAVVVLFPRHEAHAVPVRAPKSVTPATRPVTGEQVYFQQFPLYSCLFTLYDESSDWIYTEAPATAEDCAAECLSYVGCTGFELYAGSSASAYCSLWFGGACGHEDMAASSDVETFVLMDGVARFSNQYCIWTSDFAEGVDYVLFENSMTWNECLATCQDDGFEPGNATSASSNSSSTNSTTGVFTTMPTIAATTEGVSATTTSVGNSSQALPETTLVANLGQCTGIESVFSTGYEVNPILESCAHYYGGACPPQKMGDASGLPYDTARLYSLDAIGAQIAATVQLGSDYNISSMHTLAMTPAAALSSGYATCNPGSEILRGYDSCESYVGKFPCDCNALVVGDVCVGNTSAVPEEIWVTAEVLPSEAQCSASISDTVGGLTFAECRSSCFAMSDCSCFVFTASVNSSASESATGSCELLSGDETTLNSERQQEEGTTTFFTYKIDIDMMELPLSVVCPRECAATDGCSAVSQWNTLTIVFLCCLIFAVLALACAVGKWIHTMILHRRQRAAAVAERAAMAMSAESIGNIETEIFDKSTWKEGIGDPECIICLAEFENGDNLRVLKCKHRFHVACIDQWLGQQGVCPICKVDLRPAPIADPLNIQGAGASRVPAGMAENSDEESDPRQSDGAREVSGGGGGGGGAVDTSPSPPARRRSNRRRRGQQRPAQVEIEMQERRAPSGGSDADSDSPAPSP